MVLRINGDHVPMLPREPTPAAVCSIGTIDSWPHLSTAHVSPGAFLAGMHAISRLWRPAALFTNLRAGPSLWLAHAGVWRGWDVRAFIVTPQVEHARKLGDDAYYLSLTEILKSVHHEVCSSPAERDEKVRQMAEIMVTVSDVAAKRLPKMER